jgi:hypothetical protein
MLLGISVRVYLKVKIYLMDCVLASNFRGKVYVLSGMRWKFIFYF